MWSEQDLNFQPRFSSARRQPIVPFSVHECKFNSAGWIAPGSQRRSGWRIVRAGPFFSVEKRSDLPPDFRVKTARFLVALAANRDASRFVCLLVSEHLVSEQLNRRFRFRAALAVLDHQP